MEKPTCPVTASSVCRTKEAPRNSSSTPPTTRKPSASFRTETCLDTLLESSSETPTAIDPDALDETRGLDRLEDGALAHAGRRATASRTRCPIPSPARDFAAKVAALGEEGAYDDAIETLDAVIAEARALCGLAGPHSFHVRRNILCTLETGATPWPITSRRPSCSSRHPACRHDAARTTRARRCLRYRRLEPRDDRALLLRLGRRQRLPFVSRSPHLARRLGSRRTARRPRGFTISSAEQAGRGSAGRCGGFELDLSVEGYEFILQDIVRRSETLTHVSVDSSLHLFENAA